MRRSYHDFGTLDSPRSGAWRARLTPERAGR
jgi:hypothetical protein